MCVTFVETIINNMSAAAENSKKGLLSTKKTFYKVIPLAVFKNCIFWKDSAFRMARSSALIFPYMKKEQ